MITDTQTAIREKRKSRTVTVLPSVWRDIQGLVDSGEFRNVSHATEIALKRLIAEKEDHKDG